METFHTNEVRDLVELPKEEKLSVAIEFLNENMMLMEAWNDSKQGWQH